MSRSIWSVLCTDPDKCTVVIKYIILQPDVLCEVLLAANKSSTCYFGYVPVKGTNASQKIRRKVFSTGHLCIHTSQTASNNSKFRNCPSQVLGISQKGLPASGTFPGCSRTPIKCAAGRLMWKDGSDPQIRRGAAAWRRSSSPAERGTLMILRLV